MKCSERAGNGRCGGQGWNDDQTGWSLFTLLFLLVAKLSVASVSACRKKLARRESVIASFIYSS
jgi:hypothetical protein